MRFRCDHKGARDLRDALRAAVKGPGIAAFELTGVGRPRLALAFSTANAKRIAYTLEIGRAEKSKTVFELDLRGARPALLFKPVRAPSVEVGRAIDAAVRALPGAADVEWSCDRRAWHARFDDAVGGRISWG